MKALAGYGVACLALGYLIHPWNPIIKRICTSSFTIFSTGWVLLMLLAFYWVVEVKGYTKWTFPFVVIGANSIFIYSVEQVLRSWLNRAVGVFTFRFTISRRLRAGCAGLRGAAGHVFDVLLALPPKDLLQAIGKPTP